MRVTSVDTEAQAGHLWEGFSC